MNVFTICEVMLVCISKLLSQQWAMQVCFEFIGRPNLCHDLLLLFEPKSITTFVQFSTTAS